MHLTQKDPTFLNGEGRWDFLVLERQKPVRPARFKPPRLGTHV